MFVQQFTFISCTKQVYVFIEPENEAAYRHIPTPQKKISPGYCKSLAASKKSRTYEENMWRPTHIQCISTNVEQM